MQLLSMEVNQLGTGDRTQVGTLSPGLNAVCGRRGSGKSSLLCWLQGILAPDTDGTRSDRAVPPGRFDRAAGRLSLRIGELEYEIERAEQAGRTTSKILRRAISAWNGLDRPAAGSMHNESVSPLQRDALARLAAIPSDARACDRLWEVARELKLDVTIRPQHADDRLRLSSRESELQAELQPLEGLTSTREGLLARRRQLEADLERARRESAGRHYAPATDEHRRLSDRLATIERDTQKIRDEMAEIDAAVVCARNGQSLSSPASSGSHAAHVALGAAEQRSYRQRLLSLDAQLGRWRNTLSEIRAHREKLEASATDAQLDSQLGEQFSPINQATPRLALRALESQIVEARRHFDTLLEGVDRYRADHDDARHELPQTLRLMQRELHEVCQQLSRHESLTYSRANREQIQQLSRCENEMRLAIERLIAERGELLRTIATACHLSVDQVSVAYSDSCRCTDHPPLDAWLTAISADARSAAELGDSAYAYADQPGIPSTPVSTHSPLRYEDSARLEARRAAARLRLDDCQRDQHETESRLARLGMAPVPAALNERVEADILRELDNVAEELLRLETRDRLRVELTDVRRRLGQLPRDVEDANSVRGRYLRHVSGLVGRSDRDLQPPSSPDRSNAQAFELNRQLRTGQLHEVALRLAIVELLAQRGAPLPLLLDQTLDGLDGPQRLTAVRYLTGVCAAQHLQVMALTEDQSLSEVIQAARGTVLPIVVSQAIEAARPAVESDVNRQLLAYANDFESDKWGQPDSVRAPSPRREPKPPSVLTENSDIEDLPSVGQATAARMRALGVHRVADLLDTDHDWLADNARMERVTAETILAWQGEARLLCAMPHLRPFDARVLSGAGVRDQRQLSEMHPGRLLERVERFLATERGRQIMRSGSSHELARITAWLASAKRGGDQRSTQSPQSHSEADASPTFGVDPTASPARSRRNPTYREHSAHDKAPTYHVIQRDDLEGSARVRSEVGLESSTDALPERRRPKGERRDRSERGRRQVDANHAAKRDSNVDDDQHFYLELSSPVVDAPAIGATMASHLDQFGITTVGDLLSANADKLATALNLPRVTGVAVRAWQEQSRFVCRIPNLRGHDAQILVACGVKSPETLAQMEPSKLLSQVNAFANSTQGQRVLRGSQVPDLAEVTDWIQWASQSRTLLAA